MEVSVVIPTYKPDEKLQEIVRKLLLQTVRPKRILLVNSCKTEELEYGTVFVNDIRDKYKEYVDVVNIDKSEFNHGATRDMALNMCNTEFVLFMTQDAVPKNKNLVEKLLNAMKDEDVAVAYARQATDSGCDPIEKYIRQFNYPEESAVKEKADMEKMGIKTYFSSDVCAIYRKSIYNDIGGFPARTIFAEDMIYAAKAIENSKKIAYVADAVVIHSHNYSAVEQFKRNFDVGVTHRMFSYIFGNVKSETEGIRLVKSTAKYLIKNGMWYLVPKMLIHSGAKFAGYRLGKLYDRLPKKLVLLCSMNPDFFR